MDCSTENSACKGGSMDLAFEFLQGHSLCLEESYPYTQAAGVCKMDSWEDSSCTVGIPKGSVTGYYDVPSDDTNALMEAVAQQPVSVGIEADQMAFQLYSHGILAQTCGHKLD